MQVADSIAGIVRERGPLTVAAFMDVALYDARLGYYARAAQRSGRAGDFFTSVDVGPLFGRLLARQIAEMADIIGRDTFDLVEAGAGNGRLSADVLRALRLDSPATFDRVRLHLVEGSASARAAQPEVLADVADRVTSSLTGLPLSYEGILFANELLDALPVHQVVMREQGLREVYVDVQRDLLVTVEGPPSTPALGHYLTQLGVALEPGWRVEINLAAVAWMGEASRRLRRGFIILVDYGHPAHELYSVTHASGTLTSFSRHSMAGPEAGGDRPAWLSRPGEQDMTAHVDFTSVRSAAEAEGAVTIAFLDQTYFVMGLCGAVDTGSTSQPGPLSLDTLPDRLALKTLLMPGGLGSTMKVLILGKGVGTPALQGCAFRVRVT